MHPQRSGPMKTATYSLLGTEVDALSMDDLHTVIDGAIRSGERCIIGSQNLHSIFVARRDSGMREFYAQASYRRIDGMPLVMWGRLLGYPIERTHRVTWVDWLRPLLREAAGRGWRVFYLGAYADVVNEGAERLRAEFPALELGVTNGFFDASPGSEENRWVLDAIRTFEPHILMVGMGMPRQERWILDNLEDLPATVLLPCGACIDYVAGAIPTPPRWMGKVGLEWLYRLLSEPRRLARRYFVEPWFLLPLFARDLRGRVFR